MPTESPAEIGHKIGETGDALRGLNDQLASMPYWICVGWPGRDCARERDRLREKMKALHAQLKASLLRRN